jgi:hypothetical protein
MRSWSLRFIRYLLYLALSRLRALGVTASATFKSRVVRRNFVRAEIAIP